MLKKISLKEVGISLLILFGLAFILAPAITSAMRGHLTVQINWQNGELLDPNGAPPLALLALIAYIIAGLIMAKWYKAKSVLYAIIAAIIYAVFQSLNYGWCLTSFSSLDASELILTFTTTVGLTAAAYVGKRYLFNQKKAKS